MFDILSVYPGSPVSSVYSEAVPWTIDNPVLRWLGDKDTTTCNPGLQDTVTISSRAFNKTFIQAFTLTWIRLFLRATDSK